MEFNRLLEFKYLIKLVCKKYKVPDIDFFINRRDFPVLRNDKLHPYTHAYDKIKKYNNDSFIPIFLNVHHQNMLIYLYQMLMILLC